jgi:hypothetical protein
MATPHALRPLVSTTAGTLPTRPRSNVHAPLPLAASQAGQTFWYGRSRRRSSHSARVISLPATRHAARRPLLALRVPVCLWHRSVDLWKLHRCLGHSVPATRRPFRGLVPLRYWRQTFCGVSPEGRPQPRREPKGSWASAAPVLTRGDRPGVFPLALAVNPPNGREEHRIDDAHPPRVTRGGHPGPAGCSEHRTGPLLNRVQGRRRGGPPGRCPTRCFPSS